VPDAGKPDAGALGVWGAERRAGLADGAHVLAAVPMDHQAMKRVAGDCSLGPVAGMASDTAALAPSAASSSGSSIMVELPIGAVSKGGWQPRLATASLWPKGGTP